MLVQQKLWRKENVKNRTGKEDGKSYDWNLLQIQGT